MERVIWQQLDEAGQRRALARSELVADPALEGAVAAILAQVAQQGDAGLKALTEKFDGALPERWQLGPDAMAEAGARLAPELKAAIDQAIVHIGRFHQAQQPQALSMDVAEGIRCELRTEAIERVGLYVPGGSAPLISTVLMLALPARIAGCALKVMVTPPPINDAILYAAQQCGVDALYLIGGAQAVAALAYGTETVPRVDKIFGPGNRFVTEAKRQVSQQGTAIDMPAGPSEVLVLADDQADAAFVAADLLSQAEHGEDSQVILVTDSGCLADRVVAELEQQLAALPRAEIARAALAQSRVILAQDLDEACAISNAYAPEHLIVQTRTPRDLLPKLRAAGSVFLGPWTPESVGDYASGTNHVLPTYGAARTVSSLSLADFQRRFTVQELSRDGLAALNKTVVTLAQAEGLDAHANAVTLRMEKPA
ncbi:histidinol dehydrogenase [Ferrimonas balearica]|uniref:histidinol dehydrogenase n=1 Tax=Ferrimonas balearica TaxID=44012 RepID=UPI001C98EEE5|nr:histidinol dehydrogenase [Ferrimonas balearica]MBY5991407.1 histidinol dehydrogenase [Ferrimonas balearica]